LTNKRPEMYFRRRTISQKKPSVPGSPLRRIMNDMSHRSIDDKDIEEDRNSQISSPNLY